MLHEQRERTEMQVELAEAIHDGTLDLMYQPMLDSKTRQVTAFEALARWTHPIRGIVPPDTFIPLAEDTGLIFGLGAWVLRRACTEAAKWPSHIRIAVNLSVLQFRSPELVSTIIDCLTSSGLEPSRLELEITESALLEARGQNILILRTIKNLGVRISMDDFGTGYSSLLYLQNFEFDKIKLDRQLVRRAQSGVSDGAVVKAIVELANSFGMETTAEGIETSEELAMMTSLGCTELQGYLLGRPLSPVDARAFLNRNAGIQ
jgi:EAL domain-containing protein (putative c-di-GMP-specific phosphodiesterase class I)